MRNLTAPEGGGVLNPDGLCSKAGIPVSDVLRQKHPPLRDPVLDVEGGAFEAYLDGAPTPIPLVITAEVVERIAANLSGAAGPGEVDAVDLRNWLLRFGVESQALREEMAE